MTKLEQLQALRIMYTKTIKYNEEIMRILENMCEEDHQQLSIDFGHDMKRHFDLREVYYNIRNARDRIYHIGTLENELIATLENTEKCQHTIVTDYIDIDVDKGKQIEYCSKCGYTPPL